MIPPAQNPYASIGLQTSAQYSDYDGNPSNEMRYSNQRREEDDEYYDEMERQQMRGYDNQPDEEYEEEYEDEYEEQPEERYESRPNKMGFSHDIISGGLINYDEPYSDNSFEDREIIDTDGNMGDYWNMNNLIGDLKGFQKGGDKSSIDASFGLSEDVFGTGIFNRQSVGIQSQSFNDIFGGQEMGVDPQTMYGEKLDKIKSIGGKFFNKIGESVSNIENLPHSIAEKYHEGKGDLDEWNQKINDKKQKKNTNSGGSGTTGGSGGSGTTGGSGGSGTTNETTGGTGGSGTTNETTGGTGTSTTTTDTTTTTDDKKLEKTQKELKELQEKLEKAQKKNRDSYLSFRRFSDYDDDDYIARYRRGGGVGIEVGMKERTADDLLGRIGGSSEEDDETVIQGEENIFGIDKPQTSGNGEMIQGDVFGFKGMGNYGEAEDMFGKSLGGQPQDFGDIFGNFGVENNEGGRPMGFAEMFGFSIGSQSDEAPKIQQASTPQEFNPDVRTSLTSLNVKNEKKSNFRPVRTTPTTGNKHGRKPYRPQYKPRAQYPQQQPIAQQQPEMRGYRRNFFDNNNDYSERFALTDSTYAFDVANNLGFDYSNQSPDILGVSGMIGLGDSRVTTYNPTTKTMTITTKKSGKVHKTTKKVGKKKTVKPSKKQSVKSKKDDDIIRSLIWG